MVDAASMAVGDGVVGDGAAGDSASAGPSGTGLPTGIARGGITTTRPTTFTRIPISGCAPRVPHFSRVLCAKRGD